MKSGKFKRKESEEMIPDKQKRKGYAVSYIPKVKEQGEEFVAYPESSDSEDDEWVEEIVEGEIDIIYPAKLKNLVEGDSRFPKKKRGLVKKLVRTKKSPIEDPEQAEEILRVPQRPIKPRPVQIIGDVQYVEPHTKALSPKQVQPARVPLPPKGYEGPLRYGKRVKFKDSEGKTQFGTISDFKDSHLEIRGDNLRTYRKDYADIDSIKVISRKQSVEKTYQTFADFYKKPVDDFRDIRKMAVDYVFDVISHLVSDLTQEKPAQVDPVPLFRSSLKSWEQYLDDEFRIWNYHRLMPSITSEIEKERGDELRTSAIKHHKNLKSVKNLLQLFMYRHKVEGEPNFFQLDGPDMVRRIENTGKLMGSDYNNLNDEEYEKYVIIVYTRELAILDAEILMRLSRVNLQKIKRSSLSQELAYAVKKFMSSYIPSEDKLYAESLQMIVGDEFVERHKKASKKTRKQFEKEHLETLKKLYEEYSEKYKKNVKAVLEKEKDVPRSSEAIKYMAKYGRDDLTEKGYYFHKQVEAFEEVVYNRNKGNLHDYLEKVLYPTIFLNKFGDIGRHCKFFHSKIRNGEFPIRSLRNANLAHYFPELMMKYIDKEGNFINLEQKKMAEDQIEKSIVNQINQVLKQYIQAKRIEYPYVKFEKPHDINFWEGYIEKPQNICERDTETGYRNVKRLAKGFYMREPIPNDELIICHTPGIGFSCHQTRNVIEDIVFEKGINPKTGKPFPKAFIAKMKKRHPKAFEEKRKQFEKVQKEIEEESKEEQEWSEDPLEQERILFGEVIEEKKKEEEKEFVEDIESVVEEDEEVDIRTTIEENDNVLVFFYAEWCDVCLKYDSRWNRYKQKYTDITFVKLDFDENEELAGEYGVESVPSFVFIKNGKVLETNKKLNSKKIEKHFK